MRLKNIIKGVVLGTGMPLAILTGVFIANEYSETGETLVEYRYSEFLLKQLESNDIEEEDVEVRR